MKALVAGGAGFIGSHLCDRLLERGADVVCLDNFASGSATNIRHLREHPRFTLVERDLCEAPLPESFRADWYFHLASPASPNQHSPRSYMKLPLQTALANSLGAHYTLDLARRVGGRVLFASTSEVYGDPHEHPQREEYWGNVSSTGPRSCYDESKRFGEALLLVYVRSYGVDARLVRIFNTYGPRMDPDDGRMLPNFITQALRGEPLTIYGDGTYTRSLCYVDDLVRGLLTLMATSSREAVGRPYNLGNPEEHTILDYAEMVRELLPQSSSTITYRPPVPDDPSRRRPDITRARQELGWTPSVPLREGLLKTIAYFRQAIQAPDLPVELGRSAAS